MTQTLPTPAPQRRVVTTEELQELLARGYKVRLPQVARPDDAVLANYAAEDTEHLDELAAGAEVTAVQYVGDEAVQCISVDHPEHLYLTDDFVPTHNTSNIVFLKSTDDSMLDTLQKMSGTRHVSYLDSKTVTRDQERIVKGMNVEGKVSYTMSNKEEPVVSYNDMAFISERQSIVFRAGDAPVWNRNETILPMSWKMFGGSGEKSIIHPGHEYTLQTIPTLSSALDFDVRMNQPDFAKMLGKRMEQAILAQECAAKYQKAYGYSDLDITRLDPDVYSEQVMELVDAQMREEFAVAHGGDADEIDPDELEGMMALIGDATEDAEMRLEMQQREAQNQEFTRMRYAGGQVNREMLVNRDGTPNPGGLDQVLVEAFRACRNDLAADHEHFSLDGVGSLRSADGSTVYISKADESEVLAHLSEASEDDGARVYAEDKESIGQFVGYQVHPALYTYLASLGSWYELGRGEFDRRMTALMRADDVNLVDA